MADDTRVVKPEAVDAALDSMKLDEGASPGAQLENSTMNETSEGAILPSDSKGSRSNTPLGSNSSSQSPIKKQSASQTPKSDDSEVEEIIGGDISLKLEPGQAPKLSRKKSLKVLSRPPPLFNDLPDATEEAVEVFQVIKDCIYGSKYMGSPGDIDALDCDCSSQWVGGTNHACGEDSDCINRATKMECVDGDCNCGRQCQNMRFQRRLYANVSVIRTEYKGYGLRANTDLKPNDFIYEYIGEVVNQPTYYRRAAQYAEDGLKHFYFMSLNKNEYIDATKKGNLGRFCNHSCNPNCYVDKWVVGEKLRMGIFAERHIKAGEELVFNYNVDRYGSDPTPCHCGEPNCTGFLGGKTQTERATKLSTATIEALGIDDGDGWDTAIAKKPRKKKTGEDDEEYVNNVQPKGLDEEGVRKVMAALMQCKEKWIAVKLLSRIQRCDDDRVRNRVVQMHGYQILRTTLSNWKDDNSVILQVLDILYKFPRLTRNKISDSKIEATVQTFITSDHEDVAFESKRLLEEWEKLEVAYRIPRKKFDPSAVSVFERRENDRAEEAGKSPTPVAPTGPKSNLPQRTLPFVSRPPIRRPFTQLPAGWFQTTDQRGIPYFYSKAGQTSWIRPTVPAAQPAPPPQAPSESIQKAKALQDIIDSITKPDPSSQTPLQSAPPSDATPREKKKPSEKWRSLSQEKQMKLYENTLFPHIKHVMQKFTKSLPKEDLKKFAKEVGKKLVASDFKNNRVEDPTKITEKQEKKVKAYVRAYFEKAVVKKKALDKKKAEKAKAAGDSNGVAKKVEEIKEESAEVDLTPSPPGSPIAVESPDLKRKREDDSTSASGADETESFKRLKEEAFEMEVAPTPPPPPPPADGELELMNEDAFMANGDIDVGAVMGMVETEEELELRIQEEALMRENEEAMMDELKKTNGKGYDADAAMFAHSEMTGLEENGNGMKSGEEVVMSH